MYNKLQDVLALDKYRTDYENLIIALDDYANVMMFAKVLGVGARVSKLSNGEPVTNGIIEDMEKANKLKEFISTLNSSMIYIDKSKSKKSLW